MMAREWGDPVADRVKREALCFEIAQLLQLVGTRELETLRDAAEGHATERRDMERDDPTAAATSTHDGAETGGRLTWPRNEPQNHAGR